MENKLFLNRYRLSLGWNGLPVELHRTPTAIMYRGQELESGRELAIELVPWKSTDEAVRAHLEAEAAAVKQINHVSMPKLYDFGIEDGQLVYVTEYFDGHTAEAWVAARGPLPTAAVLRVAVQIADVLRAASFHHLSHRALCPANIVFLPDEAAPGEWPSVKVLHWLGLPMDFAEVGQSDTRLNTAARFASPEQLRGEKVDFPSATYSLGSSMWFLLTGALPAPAVPAVEGHPVAPNEFDKLRGVPKIVRHLLGRMLRPNPAERPQDPVALSAFLQTCLARVERRGLINRRLRLPANARPRVVDAGPARRRPRKALAMAAALLVCAALAAIAMPRYFHARTAQASAPATKTDQSGTVLQSSSGRTQRSVPAPEHKKTLPAVAANSASSELPHNEIPAKPDPSAQQNAKVAAVTSTPPAQSSFEQPAVTAATSADSTGEEATQNGIVAAAGLLKEGSQIQTPAEPEPSTQRPAEVAAVASSPAARSSLEQPTATATSANSTAEEGMQGGVVAEAAPPEEGPQMVAASPTTIRGEDFSEEEATADTAQTESPNEDVAESDDASSSVAEPPPTADTTANLALVVGDASAAPATAESKMEEPPPAEKVSKKSRSGATQSTSSKKRSAKVTHTKTRKSSRVASKGRRAKKLPLLHVGSAHAELVGTIDGKWILAVSPSNRQVIVWPPPGFR